MSGGGGGGGGDCDHTPLSNHTHNHTYFSHSAMCFIIMDITKYLPKKRDYEEDDSQTNDLDDQLMDTDVNALNLNLVGGGGDFC